MYTVLPGHSLTAPGVLKNPVLVEALYDRGAAERATLVNLLQRRGYEDLDAVLAEGRAQGVKAGHEEGLKVGQYRGLAAAVIAVLEVRGFSATASVRARVERCADAGQLDRWIRRAAVARAAEELFQDPET